MFSMQGFGVGIIWQGNMDGTDAIKFQLLGLCDSWKIFRYLKDKKQALADVKEAARFLLIGWLHAEYAFPKKILSRYRYPGQKKSF